MSQDFNTETLFNSQQNELIKSLINKISEKINDQQNKIHQEKISREILKNQISQVKQATTKQPIKQNEWNLGEIVKILPKKCPKCGANMCKRKGKNGNVIVCSSYPECDMTAQKLMSGEY